MCLRVLTIATKCEEKLIVVTWKHADTRRIHDRNLQLFLDIITESHITHDAERNQSDGHNLSSKSHPEKKDLRYELANFLTYIA